MAVAQASSCSSYSPSSLGTSICRRCGPKKKDEPGTQRRSMEHRQMKTPNYWRVSLIYISIFISRLISMTEENEEKSLNDFPYYFYHGPSLVKFLIPWQVSGPLVASEPLRGGFYCSLMSVPTCYLREGREWSQKGMQVKSGMNSSEQRLSVVH